jgi:hypothetical protein
MYRERNDKRELLDYGGPNGGGSVSSSIDLSKLAYIYLYDCIFIITYICIYIYVFIYLHKYLYMHIQISKYFYTPGQERDRRVFEEAQGSSLFDLDRDRRPPSGQSGQIKVNSSSEGMMMRYVSIY